MKHRWIPLLAFLILLLGACGEEAEENQFVQGLQPIYAEDLSPEHLVLLPPQPVESLGKIYTKDQLLFIGEQGRGIHIYDNTNPEQPINLHFLEIFGSQEIAIRGNILYVDNFQDLVAIDISDLSNPREVSRVKGVYELGNGLFPTEYSGYFECVDRRRGVVIGWEDALLTDPQCLR
ncbi:MAG: hypothetical protein AAFW73_24765 [Bacteroidota bacterium]